MTQPNTIDPDRLYPIVEACRFIPSPKGGHTTKQALRIWIHQGRIAAEVRVSRKGYRYFFIYGREILRFLTEKPVTPTPPEDRVRSPAQAARDHARATAFCEANGM